ncbi:hypothetical protein BJG93_36090 [Paraburkholderia sprentiae WSM5005]|uniref:Uncharacterized protein n=1 Tax=Paraburkholderia sprentiae WSM5005 TaxID=754502 RepID=A0A8F4QJR9_9BURK|nr:hypothetical protein [Paraburkholderia sprentiae]QXE07246.1 hypothetical protein BJG93_36090 [Paraburkholderia sprentiae WSM5005]
MLIGASTLRIGGTIGSAGIGYRVDRWTLCRALAASFGVGRGVSEMLTLWSPCCG